MLLNEKADMKETHGSNEKRDQSKHSLESHLVECLLYISNLQGSSLSILPFLS